MGSKVSNCNRPIKPATRKAHLGSTHIVSCQASELSKAGKHCLQEVVSTGIGAKQRLTWRWWKLPSRVGWLRCYLKKHLLFKTLTYLFLAALGLAVRGLSLVAASRVYSLVMWRLLIAVAPLVAEHGL